MLCLGWLLISCQCCLLINFENSLDPDQSGCLNVWHDQDPKSLTLIVFSKKKKKNHEKYPACKEFMNLNLLVKELSNHTMTQINLEHVILLTCQPGVTVTSCFVYKVIRDLESIDHLCINPIHRIGLIHK